MQNENRNAVMKTTVTILDTVSNLHVHSGQHVRTRAQEKMTSTVNKTKELLKNSAQIVYLKRYSGVLSYLSTARYAQTKEREHALTLCHSLSLCYLQRWYDLTSNGRSVSVVYILKCFKSQDNVVHVNRLIHWSARCGGPSIRGLSHHLCVKTC